MFEKIRYIWKVVNFRRLIESASTNIAPDQYEYASALYEKALKYGEEALRLQDRTRSSKIEGLSRLVDETREMWAFMEKGAFVRDMGRLAQNFSIVGADPRSYFAERMINMYDIALERLDSPETLRKEYTENEYVPLMLRAVITAYINKKLTRKKTEAKLKELKTKTEMTVKALGIDPTKNNKPTFLGERIPRKSE